MENGREKQWLAHLDLLVGRWGQPWGCGLTRMDALQDLGSLRLFARRRESGYRSFSHPAPL